MALTEQYIKMADCPEIQSAWTPREWDLYFIPGDDDFWAVLPEAIADSGVYGDIYVSEDGKVNFRKDRAVYVWLPRQDELQAMVSDNLDYPFTLIAHFDDFAQEHISEPTSMKQLWLAFVMHELYGKNWDGETWQSN